MDKQITQEELPLLSVLILAFNIEKELLDRCVSSVVQQTYTNLEIMLVNNASIDNTGIFCDEWSQKDDRILVVHNQVGISPREMAKRVTGEYVHILDHDDWLAPETYSKMMSAMLSTNSDIARCEFCYAFPDGKIEHRNNIHHTDSFEIIGHAEGVQLLLKDDEWKSYIWQNIYKKHLLDFWPPAPMKVYGDLANTHILFHHARQSVYLHDEFYHYYQRSGSIVNPLSVQGKMVKNHRRSNAIYLRYLFVKQNPEYHSMIQAIKKEATIQGLVSLWDIIDYPQYFPEHSYEEKSQWLKQLSLSVRDGIFFFFNLDLLILRKFPRCYPPFYKLFYRNLKRIKAIKKFANKNRDLD